MATAKKTTTSARRTAAPAGTKPVPAKAAAVAPTSAAKVVKRTRTAAKPLALSAPAAPAPSASPAATVAKAAADKAPKPKKPKLVRDSFTIPKAEYAVLDELKQRAGKLAQAAKKSELLRAGIKALAGLPDAAFVAALQAVPAIKTGRPSKE